MWISCRAKLLQTFACLVQNLLIHLVFPAAARTFQRTMFIAVVIHDLNDKDQWSSSVNDRSEGINNINGLWSWHPRGVQRLVGMNGLMKVDISQNTSSTAGGIRIHLGIKLIRSRKMVHLGLPWLNESIKYRVRVLCSSSMKKINFWSYIWIYL